MKMKGIYAYQRGETWTLRLESGSKADGKPKYRTFGGYETEQAAYDDAANKLVLVKTSKAVSRHDPTVWQFCDDYVTNEIQRLVKKGKRSLSTKYTYQAAIKKIESSNIAGIKLNKLTPMDIQEFVDELAECMSEKTVETYAGFLSGALGFAVSKGLLQHSPYIKIEIERSGKSNTGFWTPEQAELFIRYNQDDFIQIAVELAIYGGMRIGELLAYTWDDYDRRAKRLVTNKKVGPGGSGVTPGTKGHKHGRVIPVSDKLAEALENHRQKLHMLETNVIGIDIHSKNIVITPRGGPMYPQMLRQRFETSCKAIRGRLSDEEKKVGLPAIRFHDLRHTFVTLAYDAGVSIEIIAEITGHASKAITEQVYLHILNDRKLDAVNKVGMRITKV